METSFLITQEMKPLAWLQYKDDAFLFGLMDKRNLIHFLKNLIDLTLILNLPMSKVKRVFYFLP